MECRTDPACRELSGWCGYVCGRKKTKLFMTRHEGYPKGGNGDEYYYPSGRFLTDEGGGEIYARDRGGKQLYPRLERSGFRLRSFRRRSGEDPEPSTRAFACDASGDRYYARDAAGDEYYPLWRDRSLCLTAAWVGEGGGECVERPRPALRADGTERYPTDSGGDEYYWREVDGKTPRLLRMGTGETYLASNRNGHALIPWNRLQEHVGEEPCVYTRDAGGNTVYVRESAFPPAYQAIVRCVCHLSVICPKLTGCHTRFY